MVILYTWLPDPAAPLKGHAPDLGHSSLEVGDLYISFWPEKNSLTGMLTTLIKGRSSRQPTSYEEEIRPENGFMQRPADFADGLPELDEMTIAARWQELQDTDFDANSYNCSHLNRDLLASALPPALASRLPELCEKREHLPLTTCTPGGLRSAILELLGKMQNSQT
jgi:hypothetical protein